MRLDASEARAARAAARAEPIEYGLGELTLVFPPEMPLDVLLGVEDVRLVSTFDLYLWLIAHTLADAPCDTACLDEDPETEGVEAPAARLTACPDVTALKRRLRRVRIDGRRLDEDTVATLWSQVRAAYAVTQGESKSSADSSGTAGDTSSQTSSDTAPTPASSGAPEPAVSDDSPPSSTPSTTRTPPPSPA